MFLALVVAALVTSGIVTTPRQSSTSAAAPRETTVLTLGDVLAGVRRRSPQIEAARARQRASMQARGVLPRLPNPMVELRGENFGTAAPASINRDVFATVSQPIEVGGKRRARTTEADAVIDVATAELTVTEWGSAFDVAQLYIDALRAREVMATLVAQRDSVAALVDMLGERVDEGVSAESDLRKFETEQARLASQVTRAAVALQSSLLRLSALVGEDVRAEHLVTPVVASIVDVGASVTEMTVAKRPDVQIATARLQRAQATAAMERTLGVPDLMITAGYKRTEGFDTGVAGVSMAIPLFGRNRVAIAYATGELAAAQLELQQVRQQALADAQARRDAARELSAQSARADSDLVSPAAVVRTAARAAFVEGRGDVLQLVDAERVYGDAAREATELRLDATLARIHARLAAGESPLP